MRLDEEKIKKVRQQILNDEIEGFSAEDLIEFEGRSIEEINQAMDEILKMPEGEAKDAAMEKLGLYTLLKRPVSKKSDEEKIHPALEYAIRALDFGPGILRQTIQGPITEMIDPQAQSFIEDVGRASVGLSPTAEERMQRLGVPELGRVDLSKILPKPLALGAMVPEYITGRGALGTAIDVATGGLGLGKALRSLGKNVNKQYESIFKKFARNELQSPQELKQIIMEAQKPRTLPQSAANIAGSLVSSIESPISYAFKKGRAGKFAQSNIASELAPKIPASVVADEFKIAGTAPQMYRQFSDVANAHSKIQNEIAKSIGDQAVIPYSTSIKPVLSELKEIGKTQGLSAETKSIIKEIKRRTEDIKERGFATVQEANELKKGMQKLAQDAYRQAQSPIASPIAKTSEGITNQIRLNTYEKLASRLRQSTEEAIASIDPRIAAQYKAAGEIASTAFSAADDMKKLSGQGLLQELKSDPGKVARAVVPGLGLTMSAGMITNPAVMIPGAITIGATGAGIASRPISTRLGLLAKQLDKYAVATGPASRMIVQEAQEEINPRFDWNALIERQKREGFRP